MMTEQQRKTAESLLQIINQHYATLYKEMLARKKEKSVLQKRARQENDFNRMLRSLCKEIEHAMSKTHSLLVVSIKIINGENSNIFLYFPLKGIKWRI